MQGIADKAGWVLSLALTLSVGVNLVVLQDAAPSRRGGSAGQAVDARWLETSAPGGAAATPVVLNVNASRTEHQTNAADIIRGVQRELNARSYDAGSPDGVAGAVTRAAVMAYEHDYNLPLTATPSEELLSRIVLGSSAPQTSGRTSPPAPEAESLVRLVKQLLAGLGYQPGRIDGAMAPEAERAIREFEADQKLAETGRISGPLMSRLLRVQAQAATAKAPAVAKPAPAKQPTAKTPAAKTAAGKSAAAR